MTAVDLSLSPHELLALGEIGEALNRVNHADEKATGWQLKTLASLLRLLADGVSGTHNTDTLLSLEDVAAMHPQAEAVDEIISAIEIILNDNESMKELLQSAPLRRRNTTASGSDWDTHVLCNIIASDKLLKSHKTGNGPDFSEIENATDDQGSLNGDEEVDMSNLVAEHDCMKNVLRKAILELVNLVATSLRPFKSLSAQSDDGAKLNEESNLQVSATLVTKTDSLFAEAADEATSGSNLLSAILPVVMFYAPVLRHRHVSNMLCKASVPQLALADFISRMATNCPLASPCLLAGCFDAYLSVDDRSNPICQSSVAGVRAIALISGHSTANVIRLLAQRKIMPELLLELLLIKDPSAACALLINDISAAFLGPDQVNKNETCFSSADVTHTYKRRRRRRPHTAPSLPMVCNKWIYSCISSEIAANLADALATILKDDIVSMGEVLLMTRTIGLSVACIQSGSSEQDTLMVEKAAVAMNMLAETHVDLITSSPYRPVVTSTCIIISAFASSLGNDVVLESWKRCAACVFAVAGGKRGLSFWHEACSLKSNDPFKLKTLVLSSLVECASYGSKLNPIFCKINTDNFDICSGWIAEKMGIEDLSKPCKQLLTVESLVRNPTKFLDIVTSLSLNEGIILATFRDALCDEDACMKLMKVNSVVSLVERVAHTKHFIPLVLPMDYARDSNLLWNSCDINSSTMQDQNILQLFYLLKFSQVDPNRPFRVEPRNLELDKVLNYCNKRLTLVRDGGKREIYKSLSEAIYASFPDLRKVPPSSLVLDKNDAEHSIENGGRRIPRLISHIIQKAIEDREDDKLGRVAERLYFQALKKQFYPIHSLNSAVACALLSSANSHPPCLTYSMLCGDPLVLLKCELIIWKQRSLREILLAVLTNLLYLNEVEVSSRLTPSPNAKNELILSRDALVVRCLLTLHSGVSETLQKGTSGKRIVCKSALSLLRSLVTRRRGLTPLLVKQGLPELSLNFFIDFVPETFMDASIFLFKLQQKSVSTVERLCVADAALRIAIKHGARNEEMAQQIAFAALSVMVNSFYIALGPTGASVNALREENSDINVCQKCRLSLFRMIQAMQNIHEKRKSLKNECSLALSKLAGLCKQEGEVKVQQKRATLQHIWDAITLSINAMGGRVQI